MEDLLRLALAFAGTAEGLSFTDIQARFEVSRSTAERMRDAVARVFPQLTAVHGDGRTLRWRLPHGTLSGLLDPSTAELAELEVAIGRLRAEGAPTERVELLERLAGKLRAAMRPAALRRAETDVAALMEAEGIAVRPGPRPVLPEGLLATLREAILACREVRFGYAAQQGAARPATRTVRPLGLLHGARPYLVASVANTPGDPTLFRLDRMRGLEVLDGTFVRDTAFQLAAFAARSFGVFQEEPVDVCLRFSAEAAGEARRFHFHATQRHEELLGGRLLVRFTAGGRREMIQHLATWGDAVEVLGPESFRAELAKWARVLARHHGRVPAATDTLAVSATTGAS